MAEKLMLSDLIYDADIVIAEIIKGKTHYYEAELAPSVESPPGIIVTVILRKGEELSIAQVMKGER